MIGPLTLEHAFAVGEEMINRRVRLLHGNLHWDIYRGRAINVFCEADVHNTWDEVCWEGHDGLTDPHWREKGSDYRRPTVYVCDYCFQKADCGRLWESNPGRPIWDGGHAVKHFFQKLRPICDWWMREQRYMYPKSIAFIMLEYWCDFSFFQFLQPEYDEIHFWYQVLSANSFPHQRPNVPSKSKKRRARRQKNTLR